MPTTSASTTAVDLSRLPAPSVVEVLSYEVILAGMVSDLQARDPVFTALVESDPAFKILEVCTYRELLLRQRVNEAARAVMPAYALGPDLDALAAIMGVTRLQISAGDPANSIPPTYESDVDFRRRAFELAPEGFSVAGPEAAYVFHALSASGDVLDASAISPEPGQVLVTVLSRSAGGVASAGLLASVGAAVSAEDVRPLTDQVTVQAATVTPFDLQATVYTFAGPDAAVVLAEGAARLAAYLADSFRLGRDVTRSAINAALFCPGVQRIEVISPAADIVVDRTQAALCSSQEVTHGGVAE